MKFAFQGKENLVLQFIRTPKMADHDNQVKTNKALNILLTVVLSGGYEDVNFRQETIIDADSVPKGCNLG